MAITYTHGQRGILRTVVRVTGIPPFVLRYQAEMITRQEVAVAAGETRYTVLSLPVDPVRAMVAAFSTVEGITMNFMVGDSTPGPDTPVTASMVLRPMLILSALDGRQTGGVVSIGLVNDTPYDARVTVVYAQNPGT